MWGTVPSSMMNSDLEGALSIFEIWWTRWDSNPRPPHCEQWGNRRATVSSGNRVACELRLGASRDTDRPRCGIEIRVATLALTSFPNNCPQLR